MANKKKESIVDEIENSVVKTAKKIKDDIEQLAEETVEALEGKKKPAKEDKKNKLAALMAKAKALEGKISKTEEVSIKEKVSGEEKKDTLVPMDDYLKSSIHLGTRVITPDMRFFVYRRRADGLAVFNTSLLDTKIREGAKYLAKFAPEQIVVACKREAGWKAVNMFGETLGIKTFTKKYPAGTLTNANLEDFFERDVVLICDPWLDKNLITDAGKIKIPVIGICDTNNFTQGIDMIIPGNNKSYKSIGMIFYLLTKLYIEERKLDIPIPPIESFVEGWAELQAPA